MSDAPTIRTMGREDVDFAMALATGEGWNSGLSDAESFFAADPEGFFLAELDGRPVGCISAVRYGDGFGFAGLYIMIPEARGRGWGLRLWNHALRRLDGCANIGLDAVPAQEANYVRSGFATAYRSARYEGVAGGTVPESVHRLGEADFADVAAYDRQCFPAPRDAFLRAWLAARGSHAFGVRRGGVLAGYGVIRPCIRGCKVGPLFADDAAAARDLLEALTASVPGETFYLDVARPNRAAVKLAEGLGLTEVFATVRMYTAGQPAVDLDKVFGVTSFELG
ncbi:GNAT family N-acetyltransferase [Pseudodesulfovibrio sp.]|uniref:GNAT family N-acetyltransferase n=1 Tax=Pseudodesulfovibrio sp. TaxID=2035812 RepID=UPI002620A0C3|nr:GNAT family N-acetyltransferase [Pseudodesulfovibrio sp.]MDD3311065.1 GNAT family N-acetyltransferase [Pseudodesulfovibrio sp.]